MSIGNRKRFKLFCSPQCCWMYSTLQLFRNYEARIKVSELAEGNKLLCSCILCETGGEKKVRGWLAEICGEITLI